MKASLLVFAYFGFIWMGLIWVLLRPYWSLVFLTGPCGSIPVLTGPRWALLGLIFHLVTN